MSERTTVKKILCALLVVISGCDGEPESNKKLYEQVSFDFDCPRDRIHIIMMTNDYNPRAVVDVCGTRRKFRDVGGNHYNFEEIRESTPACGSASAK